jgi:hypothetical protein
MAAKERPVELADMDGSRSAFAAGAADQTQWPVLR